jgi:predicted Fe-Mo cluster-binding NifX family protein
MTSVLASAAQIMERIAMPIFQARISPVLDACNDVMLVDIDEGQAVRRRTVSLEKMTQPERAETLARWGVTHIICAGVSDLLSHYIESRGIQIISGIAGGPEPIVDAYIHNRLRQACFMMPGKKRPYPTDSS